MPDSLYERDVLAWSEQQADLLRKIANTERVNLPVDWENVIEEVQDVGNSELRSCYSLLRQAMLHLLKLHAWPESGSAEHWRQEIATFLDNAADHFTPSMRQRLDLVKAYSAALERARETHDRSGLPRALPDRCPFTLDELLAGKVGTLRTRLGEWASGQPEKQATP